LHAVRAEVRTWLEALGYKPTDVTDAARGDDWAWHVVLAPEGLEVLVRARTGEPNVVVEAFVTLGLEALGSRRGPDAAHRVRAAILRPRSRDVETEIHRNGKAWLRSTLGAEELGKQALEERLRAVQEEHRIILRWVTDALATGALPR
jgi:hypothetical protein